MKFKKFFLPLVVFLAVCFVSTSTIVVYRGVIEDINRDILTKRIVYLGRHLIAAQRPDGRRTYYFGQGLNGTEELVDLAALDINATGNPNNYDLMDGDGAIVIYGGTAYQYYFDADGTDAESSPDVIRPDDFVTEGVWKLVKTYVGDFSIGGVEFVVSADCSAEDGNTYDRCYETGDNSAWHYESGPQTWVSEGSGSLTAHLAAYDHQAMVDHIAETGNAHSADLEDIIDGVSIGSSTPTGGDVDWSNVDETHAPRAIETIENTDLNDSTTPYVLTQNELIGLAQHSNYGAGEVGVYQFPDEAEGWDAWFHREYDAQITLTPYAGGAAQWEFKYFGQDVFTQLAVDENIVNSTSGESVNRGFVCGLLLKKYM